MKTGDMTLGSLLEIRAQVLNDISEREFDKLQSCTADIDGGFLRIAARGTDGFVDTNLWIHMGVQVDSLDASGEWKLDEEFDMTNFWAEMDRAPCREVREIRYAAGVAAATGSKMIEEFTSHIGKAVRRNLQDQIDKTANLLEERRIQEKTFSDAEAVFDADEFLTASLRVDEDA